jgi:hypothetical protein
MPSVADVPERVKHQERMCRGGLTVGVKLGLLQEAAVKANAIKALMDSD